MNLLLPFVCATMFLLPTGSGGERVAGEEIATAPCATPFPNAPFLIAPSPDIPERLYFLDEVTSETDEEQDEATEFLLDTWACPLPPALDLSWSGHAGELHHRTLDLSPLHLSVQLRF